MGRILVHLRSGERPLQLEFLREKSGRDDAVEGNEFSSCRVLMALLKFRRN